MNKNIMITIEDNLEPVAVEFYYANSDKYISLNTKLRNKKTNAVCKGIKYEILFLHEEGSDFIYEMRKIENE